MVYPRVYGGTSSSFSSSARNLGLSPRVRGNLDCIAHSFLLDGSIPACTGEPRPAELPLDQRSIPACTGEPSLSRKNGFMRQVYPRVYGGTNNHPVRHWRDHGLSPRVRGNQLEETGEDADTRSIPACTGEPLQHAQEMRQIKVYPRVYGGTAYVVTDSTSTWGLSPRVRGNQHPWHGP